MDRYGVMTSILKDHVAFKNKVPSKVLSNTKLS